MNALNLTYCESHSWLTLAQPWNTISNGLFVIVALIVMRRVYKQELTTDRFMVWLIGSIALIGICSFFWHATLYPWALIIDVLGIIIFAISYIYYVGLRRLYVSRFGSTLVVLAVIASCVMAMFLTDGHLPQRSGAFIPLALLFMGAGVKLYKKYRHDAWYIIGAGMAMTGAIIARVADLSVCDHVHMGTHFIWHGLTAVTVYLLMIPLIRHSDR